MLELLRGLLADPGSPLEVIVFVAVVAALTAGIAALLYLLALSGLWAFRGRPAVGFWRLFLPTRVQVRQQVVDATLGAATALIVLLTLVVRHQVVARIEGFPLGQLVGVDQKAGTCHLRDVKGDLVARLFPAGAVPSAVCDALGRSLQTGASSLLAPVVEAGRSAAARALVEEIARRVAGEPQGLARYLGERSIRRLCLAFLLLYVLWLAFDRLATLRLDPKARTPYSEIARRFLTLGVCLALLLVAVPRLVGDTELLADGVLASLERGDAEPPGAQAEELAARVKGEIRAQYELPLLLVSEGAGEARNVWTAIGQARAEAKAGQEALRGELAAADARLATVDGRVSALDGRLAVFDDRLAGLDTRLAAASASVDATNAALATARADTGSLRDELRELGRRLAGELAAVRQGQAELAAGLKDGLERAAETLRLQEEAEARRLASLEARMAKAESAIAALQQPKDGTLIVFPAYRGQAFLLDGQQRVAPAVEPVTPGPHSVHDVRTGQDLPVRVPEGAAVGVALPSLPRVGPGVE